MKTIKSITNTGRGPLGINYLVTLSNGQVVSSNSEEIFMIYFEDVSFEAFFKLQDFELQAALVGIESKF